MARQIYSSAFTLLELLVVIAIIILVAGFTVPAVTGLSKSNNLSTGGRMVSNLLTVARSEAINRRALVRLEIATTWPSDPSSAYRKITLVQHDVASGNNTQLTNWQTLPTGIAFQDPAAAPSSGNYFLALNQTETPQLKAGNQTVDTNYLEFLPTGAPNIDPAKAPIRFRIVQGYISNTGNVTQTGSNNWFEVSVDGLIGRMQVIRP